MTDKNPPLDGWAAIEQEREALIKDVADLRTRMGMG